MAKKIKVKVFDELSESLQDALVFERNRRGGIHDTDLRVTELPPPSRKLRPRDIRAIRRSLNASQELFARFLNVSANTIRSWEQGTAAAGRRFEAARDRENKSACAVEDVGRCSSCGTKRQQFDYWVSAEDGRRVRWRVFLSSSETEKAWAFGKKGWRKSGSS